MFNFLRKKDVRSESLLNIQEHTLDLSSLQQRPHHLLFDYGDKLPLPEVSVAYTVERMTLWSKRVNGDGISAVAMSCKAIRRARISGFMYVLNTEQMVELDNCHQNGVCFKRKRVQLFTPHIDYYNNTIQTEAWMYVAKPQFWATAVDWDTSFYRGYGEFNLATLHDEPAELRQLQIGSFYLHRPVVNPPFKVSLSTHLRTGKMHEEVRVLDEGAAEAEAKYNLQMSLIRGPTKIKRNPDDRSQDF